MGRLKARAAQKRKQEQQQQQATFWPELCRRIAAGQVIPIVSNAVSFDQIFDNKTHLLRRAKLERRQ